MKKLALIIISANIIFSIQAQNSKPKLVVGIVVDQMRYDYISRYWDKLEKNGFKRFVNEGAFCKNARQNYIYTQTGPGHATIYTGATPSVNGIVSTLRLGGDGGAWKYILSILFPAAS